MVKPTYTHACKSCRYLGTYTAEDHPQDLYLCGDPGHRTMVVVRSDDPHDTYGFMTNTTDFTTLGERFRAMVWGLKVAKSKGLL